jgi:2-aminoadipate transaminase
MLEAIAKYFPAGVHCVEPDGGMFIWCRMPEKVNAMELFKTSVKKGVAFVDGSVFHANGGGENTMRLNFTSSTDDQIRTGIEKLGEAIRESL